MTNRPKKPIPHEEMVRLYMSGLSIRKVSVKLGITYPRVWAALHDESVPLRRSILTEPFTAEWYEDQNAHFVKQMKKHHPEHEISL